MPFDPKHALLAFGSIFSIVDPFAAVPIFLALVGGQARPQQNRIALRASMTCLLVLTTFGIAGSFIFSFFSITIPAFKIAGGILLFRVGLEMMSAKKSDTRSTREEVTDAETKEDVGLIPIGLPLLAGPGSIATVMVMVSRSTTMGDKAGIMIAIGLVSLLAFLVLRSAAFMTRVLGKTGINIIGRIMGLILAATAVQFCVDGLREAFPHLFGA
jgi:multiple antibiotic resistance protein